MTSKLIEHVGFLKQSSANKAVVKQAAAGEHEAYFQGFMAKCAEQNIPEQQALQLWHKQAAGGVGRFAYQMAAQTAQKGATKAVAKAGTKAVGRAGAKATGKAGGRAVPTPDQRAAARAAGQPTVNARGQRVRTKAPTVTPPAPGSRAALRAEGKPTITAEGQALTTAPEAAAQAVPPAAQVGRGLISRVGDGAKNLWSDTVAPQLSRLNQSLPQPVQQFNQGARQGFKELGMRVKGQTAELDAARAAVAGQPTANVVGRRLAYAAPGVGALGLGYGAMSGD